LPEASVVVALVMDIREFGVLPVESRFALTCSALLGRPPLRAARMSSRRSWSRSGKPLKRPQTHPKRARTDRTWSREAAEWELPGDSRSLPQGSARIRRRLPRATDQVAPSTVSQGPPQSMQFSAAALLPPNCTDDEGITFILPHLWHRHCFLLSVQESPARLCRTMAMASSRASGSCEHADTQPAVGGSECGGSGGGVMEATE